MYSFEKRYYNDEKLRLIDASQLNNENDEYIVLFQRDALQNFIDCYCKFYFTMNDAYDDYIKSFKIMCNVFDKQIVINEFEKIFSKYDEDVKIINCMYFDYLNTGDYALFFVVYEKQMINEINTFVDIYEIDYDFYDYEEGDEFHFKINDYASYLFFNKYNAMQFLFDYNNDYEKIEIKSSYYHNLSKYINNHNKYVSKFENVSRETY
jgi:hypothetical protein